MIQNIVIGIGIFCILAVLAFFIILFVFVCYIGAYRLERIFKGIEEYEKEGLFGEKLK